MERIRTDKAAVRAVASRQLRLLLLCLALSLVLVSCHSEGTRPKSASSPAEQAAVQPPEVSQPTAAVTQVEMVNVSLHLDSALILRIRYLEGQFLPTRKGHPPTFDDKLSYIVAIDSAEVGISMASMTHAINTYVFNKPDAPLKNLKLSAEGDAIKQTGTLKKGPGIPFETVGTMSVTPDGKIRMHSTKVKAAHLPVKGLMKLFGLDIAKLINTRNTRGITVDGNDLILDPTLFLPPPRMRGRITSVRIQGDEIIQTFGKEKTVPGTTPRSNYMAYRGGVLRFGKLTMTDTDMRLIDADPSDPFDFFPDHYNEHLVSGYSKTTASGGLLVYMLDYNKIAKPVTPH